MIIGASSLSMASTHTKTVKEEKASIRVGNMRISADYRPQTVAGITFRDRVRMKSAENAGYKHGRKTGTESRSLDSFGGIAVQDRVRESEDERSIDEIRRQSIMYFLSRIREIFAARSRRNYGTEAVYDTGDRNLLYSEYQSYSYEETEETDFESCGKVITADGREIDFKVSMSMSRSFAEYFESRLDVYAPEDSLMDPLVINLDGNVAEVSDQKFFFDLDADGKLDEISRLGSGSGYLALDLDGDGRIRDGRELFGTRSGNGFADLARYDSDGNGWIDEADPVFEKLRIWVTDENGKETLYGLKEKGVGAICLQNLSTDFDLKSEKTNAMNGKIRKTGCFLYESGMAGTIQHVDLAVNAAG